MRLVSVNNEHKSPAVHCIWFAASIVILFARQTVLIAINILMAVGQLMHSSDKFAEESSLINFFSVIEFFEKNGNIWHVDATTSTSGNGCWHQWRQTSIIYSLRLPFLVNQSNWVMNYIIHVACYLFWQHSSDLQCESKKSPPPRGPDIFSFFRKRLRIFNRFFTHLLHVPIYATLQIVIQLSPIFTKLCHIKRDCPVHIICSKCPQSAKTHAFRRFRKSLIALLIVVCGK